MKHKSAITILIILSLWLIAGVYLKQNLFNSNLENQDQTAYQKAKKLRNPKFNTLSLGMSQEDVIKKLGQPSAKTTTKLSYGEFYLTFTDDKLTNGNPPTIVKKVAKEKNKQKLAAENKKFNQKENILKLNAMEFGQKDLQTVQNFVGTMYSSVYLGDTTAYVWQTSNGSLIRIDKPQYDHVGVYKYEKGMIKEQLYSGHTIVQPSPRQNTLYGNQ